MMDLDERFFWFRRRKTKTVEGGIKAHAARFGEHWWSGMWLLAIEDSGSRNRLARGRSYARKGQITDFHVMPGKIAADVQGSADKPYHVEIGLPVLKQDLREKVIEQMKLQPLFIAKLLNREMPEEIIGLFHNAGAALFPTGPREVRSSCTCPDDANPCKHIAAVFYLFSLELERDPFLMLALRGLDPDSLLAQFRQSALFAVESAEHKPEPLPSDPTEFWRSPRIPAAATSTPPRENATLVKQLGTFPLWRGESPFLKTLETYYAASTRAQRYLNPDFEE